MYSSLPGAINDPLVPKMMRGDMQAVKQRQMRGNDGKREGVSEGADNPCTTLHGGIP